jgi:hypothetical protein
MSYGYTRRQIEVNKKADGRLLGVKLGRVCIGKDIPVSEVSETLGVCRQTVYCWFAGNAKPQARYVEPIKKLITSLR